MSGEDLYEAWTFTNKKQKFKRCEEYFLHCFFDFFLYGLYSQKLQPSFIEYAKVYSNNIANEVVNSAVDDVFVKEEYQSLKKIMENSSKI